MTASESGIAQRDVRVWATTEGSLLTPARTISRAEDPYPDIQSPFDAF
jgi:hypothetical protein